MYNNEFQSLQEQIGAANASQGFHGSHDVPEEFRDLYWISKLGLIQGEATEALDELRDGHAVDEVYYKVDDAGEDKPEGFPVELADVVIRALDLADEANIDLWDVIDLKLRYNATRAFRHGKKF